ncbi:MAG TPA: cyclic nucleotide-binding domain-containing protein [Planctomycetaceae bacterium]|nr:cyclic nucleotide-binding domain-containing protein [Planctomycetaceae bacterium]
MRLFLPLELGEPQLFEKGRPVAEAVIRSFQSREVLPRVADAIPAIPLFRDLTEDQQRQLASICRLESFESGTLIYETGQPSDRIYILLSGEVEVMPLEASGPTILVRPGECLGEMSLLRATPHSAAARARTAVEAAVIDHDDLLQLARRRPDVGATIFRNLARGLTEKLASLDARFLETRPND